MADPTVKQVESKITVEISHCGGIHIYKQKFQNDPSRLLTLTFEETMQLSQELDRCKTEIYENKLNNIQKQTASIETNIELITKDLNKEQSKLDELLKQTNEILELKHNCQKIKRV